MKARVRKLTDNDLQRELQRFERRFGMSSDEFVAKFERGEMGDAAEVIRWAAYCEMSRRSASRPVKA